MKQNFAKSDKLLGWFEGVKLSMLGKKSWVYQHELPINISKFTILSLLTALFTVKTRMVPIQNLRFSEFFFQGYKFTTDQWKWHFQLNEQVYLIVFTTGKMIWGWNCRFDCNGLGLYICVEPLEEHLPWSFRGNSNAILPLQSTLWALISRVEGVSSSKRIVVTVLQPFGWNFQIRRNRHICPHTRAV